MPQSTSGGSRLRAKLPGAGNRSVPQENANLSKTKSKTRGLHTSSPVPREQQPPVGGWQTQIVLTKLSGAEGSVSGTGDLSTPHRMQGLEQRNSALPQADSCRDLLNIALLLASQISLNSILGHHHAPLSTSFSHPSNPLPAGRSMWGQTPGLTDTAAGSTSTPPPLPGKEQLHTCTQTCFTVATTVADG